MHRSVGTERHIRAALTACISLALLLLQPGCRTTPAPVQRDPFASLAPPPAQGGPQSPSQSRSESADQTSHRNAADARAIAIINGQPIEHAQLATELSEAAGGIVLREHALTMTLRREVASRGLRVESSALDDERARLGNELAANAGLPDSEGFGLVERSRIRRGLGEARFGAWLFRQAALRAIVRSDAGTSVQAAISDDDLALAYALKFGPRVRVRMLLLDSAKTAAQARDQLASVPFAEVAHALSIDPSSQVGGLLDPLSPDDPALPAVIRRQLAGLAPGQLGEAVSVNWAGRTGIAIIKLEERLAPESASPTYEQARPSLAQALLDTRERALMEQLAQRLQKALDIRVLDRSFGWSFDHTPEASVAAPTP